MTAEDRDPAIIRIHALVDQMEAAAFEEMDVPVKARSKASMVWRMGFIKALQTISDAQISCPLCRGEFKIRDGD